MTPRNRALLIALAIFLADQAMKAIILGPMGLEVEGQTHYIAPIFSFTLTQNIGVSLGLFNATTEFQRWALVAVTGGISLFVARWLWTETNRTDLLALGSILGGACGNVTDRIRLGHVTDYADLHFGAFKPFLVFNLADAAITVGVLILLARALFTQDGRANVVEKQDA